MAETNEILVKQIRVYQNENVWFGSFQQWLVTFIISVSLATSFSGFSIPSFQLAWKSFLVVWNWFFSLLFGWIVGWFICLLLEFVPIGVELAALDVFGDGRFLSFLDLTCEGNFVLIRMLKLLIIVFYFYCLVQSFLYLRFYGQFQRLQEYCDWSTLAWVVLSYISKIREALLFLFWFH